MGGDGDVPSPPGNFRSAATVDAAKMASVGEAQIPAGTAAQRDLVRRGYDAISLAYRNDQGRSGDDNLDHPTQYEAWIDELAPLLAPNARVLDLGCGCGVPATRALTSHGFDVVGLDFSEAQIARARRLVPDAEFVHADMTEWDGAPSSFDAIVSFYALIHVPLEDQRRVIARLPVWLAPGGWALLIVGATEWRGVGDFLGTPMFWDHADGDTYVRWLQEAGLGVAWRRFIPEGDGGHDLVLARRFASR